MYISYKCRCRSVFILFICKSNEFTCTIFIKQTIFQMSILTTYITKRHCHTDCTARKLLLWTLILVYTGALQTYMIIIIHREDYCRMYSLLRFLVGYISNVTFTCFMLQICNCEYVLHWSIWHAFVWKVLIFSYKWWSFTIFANYLTVRVRLSFLL